MKKSTVTSGSKVSAQAALDLVLSTLIEEQREEDNSFQSPEQTPYGEVASLSRELEHNQSLVDYVDQDGYLYRPKGRRYTYPRLPNIVRDYKTNDLVLRRRPRQARGRCTVHGLDFWRTKERPARSYCTECHYRRVKEYRARKRTSTGGNDGS